MSYIKAEEVLPEDILKLIQNYVDGKLLYIPKKSPIRNDWGSASGIKEYYAKRNSQIYKEYHGGASYCELSEKYFLSKKSIQRIIRNNMTSCYNKKN
ncbi:MAG: hypothetical protein IJA52_09940 [Clostridia bacterium]|nr:hypothetical protein [Clostridia bacterium]